MDKKQFYVTANLSRGTVFDKYEDAVNHAKRLVAPNQGYSYSLILEGVAKVQAPVPEAEVTKLT